MDCNVQTALVFQNPDHQLLLPSCGSDLLLNLPPTLAPSLKRKRIAHLLEQVGLAGMDGRQIHTLSGGQKQRLAIAGALASEAKLMLLDEPTALLGPIEPKLCPGNSSTALSPLAQSTHSSLDHASTGRTGPC